MGCKELILAAALFLRGFESGLVASDPETAAALNPSVDVGESDLLRLTASYRAEDEVTAWGDRYDQLPVVVASRGLGCSAACDWLGGRDSQRVLVDDELERNALLPEREQEAACSGCDLRLLGEAFVRVLDEVGQCLVVAIDDVLESASLGADLLFYRAPHVVVAGDEVEGGWEDDVVHFVGSFGWWLVVTDWSDHCLFRFGCKDKF